MYAKIDTIQIETDRKNVESVFTDLQEKCFIKEDCLFIRPKKNNEDSLVMVLHPSRYEGRYNSSNSSYTFSYYKKQKAQMLHEIQVKVKDEVKVSRLDLCFDLVEDFNGSIYPLLELLALLYSFEYKTENTWKNVSLFNLKTHMIVSKASKNELAIYNKKKESNNKHIYSTRIEFKFKELKASKNVEEKKINDLNELLDRLYGNLAAAEQARAATLYKLYLKELEEGITQDFAEFVRHHKDHFCTRNVLKMVYEKTDLKGKFSNWIKFFRRSNEITLYNDYSVKCFLNDIKRALKAFKNS